MAWATRAIRGWAHPDFLGLARVLELCVPRAGPGGAALAVHHRGELVANLAMGTRDRQGRPFEPETLALGLSTSKGVTATLLHTLVDRGELDLDAAVADYWPEFAAAGKQAIRVRELVSHQAGLHPIRPLIARFEQLYDWEHMVAALAAAAPVHEPGRHLAYHAWTYGWLVAELMQRATGASFNELLRARIVEPLALGGLYFGLPEHARERLAEFIHPAFAGPRTGRWGRALLEREALSALLPPGLASLDLNDPRLLAAVLPSVNGVFDALSLSRLYAALAGGGRLAEVELLSPAAVARARADQNPAIGRVIPFPLRVKMGYHRPVALGLRVDLAGRAFDLGPASADAFGHFGLGGSGAWADPSRELSVGLVTNCFAGRLPADVRTVAVCTAANLAADRR